MAYRYAVDRIDYTDYSSGKVFYSLPGRPALPIRLVMEIFQRCNSKRIDQGLLGPCTIYDPCGGGAYHLTTLGYMQWNDISQIISSDIDAEANSLAQRNLSLLTLSGMEKRINEINEMHGLFGKESHIEALSSAMRLRNILEKNLALHSISTRVFHADATNGIELRKNLIDQKIYLVITDVPYGRKSNWQTADIQPDLPERMPVWHMLDALIGVVLPTTLIAVVADKQQVVTHPAYQRIEKFKVGKRQVCILQPV